VGVETPDPFPFQRLYQEGMEKIWKRTVLPFLLLKNPQVRDAG
jgi:hypothetical protein